jgi:holin-like protein
VASFALRLPIPGPVIGMALLLGYLMLKDDAATRLRPASVELLKHLSLLFVPAGVGVMLHASRLANEWLPILVALVASTALAIAVTALVIEWTRRRLGGGNDSAPEPAAGAGREPQP